MNSYFSHDSNARNDEKIIALRILHGWGGCGLYWAIIEKLRDATDYRLSTDYSLIAYDLQVDIEIIRSIVCDLKLFVVEKEYFYAQSLCKRMGRIDEKSDKARESAKSRWQKTKPVNISNPADSDTTASFVPPNLAEVKAYCEERKNEVDAERFINFYESKGWMVGRNKMKNWKSSVRVWERDLNGKQINNEPQDATERLHPALQ